MGLWRPSVVVLPLLLLCLFFSREGAAQTVVVSNEQALMSALSQGLNISLTESIELMAELAISASVRIQISGKCEGGMCKISAKGQHRHMSILGPETTVMMSNLTLLGGSADRGGSIRVAAGATAIFTGVLFSGNSATGMLQGGGAIQVAGNSFVYIYSSVFEENNAAFGGALEATENSSLSVLGSQFYKNTATVAGGAINVIGGSELVFQKGSIVKSFAPIGGAINVANASASICNSNTTDNVAAIADHGPEVLSGRGGDVALCRTTPEVLTLVRGGTTQSNCMSCSPLPGRGHHPPGRGHHPVGVGKHAPRVGHHKSRKPRPHPQEPSGVVHR